MANTSSGRTARLNVRITEENKAKLKRHKGILSEAAFTDSVLSLYFARLERRAEMDASEEKA